jgi:DNA-binding NarL/FixJ family response regulator
MDTGLFLLCFVADSMAGFSAPRGADEERVMAQDTRILIADDHPMVRSALKQAIVGAAGADFEVLEAASLASVRECLAAVPVDLILLDLNMPGMDSILSLSPLRSDFPAVPILVVSATEDARVVAQAMEFGAAGFLPKSAPFGDIAEAVKAVLAGELWFPEGSEPNVDSLDQDLVARIAELTPQQRRVFLMVAHGKSNKEIAFELNIQEGTVKAHVSQILLKLGVNSRTEAALVAGRFNGAGVNWMTYSESAAYMGR